MKIYTIGESKVFRDKIFVEKMKNILAICFDNSIEGNFSIYYLPFEQNKKIKQLLNKKKNAIYSPILQGKNQYTEIIPYEKEAIIYINPIIGNSSFYLINDNISDLSQSVDEIPDEYKKKISGLELLYNKTIILKKQILFFCLYDFYFQKFDDIYEYLGFDSKIKFFKKGILYKIYLLLNNNNYLIKLLSLESDAIIYNNEENLILNNTNSISYLNKNDEYFIEGNDSIVAFYVPLTNNNNYSICEHNVQNFKNVQEIFIIPNETKFDAINIFILYSDNEKENIKLIYLDDFNILPYSRKNFEISKNIELKKNKKSSLLIPNLYKENEIEHLENEKYFIYFKFSDILLNFTVEINYINYIFINKNENIILSPGIKRIFLGYDSKNYIKLDLCQNSKI